VFHLATDPLSDVIHWPPCHAVDIAMMESVMSYHVGNLGVVRSATSVCVSVDTQISSPICRGGRMGNGRGGKRRDKKRKRGRSEYLIPPIFSPSIAYARLHFMKPYLSR